MTQTNLTGRTAIIVADMLGVQLRKHADPTAPAADIDADAARAICREDPSLVYVDSAEVAGAIDDATIIALRGESATAGDADQRALSALAIDGSIWPDDHRDISARMAERLATMTRGEARVECARVIAAARAQR